MLLIHRVISVLCIFKYFIFFQIITHYIGNEHLHQITSQGKYKLRIDLQDFENNTKYANYNHFEVGDEKSGYKLTVAGYDGNAGELLNNIELNTRQLSFLYRLGGFA